MAEPAKEAANIVTRLDEWDKYVGHGTDLFKAAKDEIERLLTENESLKLTLLELNANRSLRLAVTPVNECKRLRAALHDISAMFYIGYSGACLMKPEYGYYDVLETANAALAVNEQSGVKEGE